MDTLLVTIPEAARAMSISRSRLYELMGEGALKTVRLGRRRLIKVDSIHAYVDALAMAA